MMNLQHALSSVAWGPLAQMITASSTVVALFLAPRLAGRNEHRKIVANSRQAWLDAIRNDVSELIAKSARIVEKNDDGTLYVSGTADSNDIYQTDLLMQRIRLRLNLTRSDQALLFDELTNLIQSGNQEDFYKHVKQISLAMEALSATVWGQIKAGSV